MKRSYLMLIIVFIFIIIFIDTNDSKQIRFRVIANSNSYVDQKIKMEVVNELMKENISIENLSILKKKAEYIVLSNNVNYEVSACIKKQKFETKYYNNKIIEGGTYKTIVITLGNGEGKNYWTILYPEYFGVSFEDVNTGNVNYDIWIFKKIKEWKKNEGTKN